MAKIIRYRVISIESGKELNTWTSEVAGPDYHEPSFEREGAYKITEEDITANMDAQKAKEAAQKQVRDQLKLVNKNDAKSLEELRDLVFNLAALLGLK